MRAKWPRPMAGAGSPAIRPSSSTSSAATAIDRYCCRWSNVSERHAPAANLMGIDVVSGTMFYAAAAMGRKVRARTLVASDGFSARYDLDRIRGTFSRPEHKLAGQSYRGRVLVLDAAKGGVATAWMLHGMKARDVMPAALVLNRVNPIMVQGAALADFTMISGFDVDITAAVPDGALVEIDPDTAVLRVLADA